VENASFMPWLVGTALMHSLAVTEKRGSFKNWTVLLAISAFSLSLLGTFLVRSGVLTSVHAFATDPRRGIFILALPGRGHRRLAGAVCLARAQGRPRRPLRAGLARVAAAHQQRAAGRRLRAVLLGTLYPLLIDALGMGKLSVGPPYFDAVFVPLMSSGWNPVERCAAQGPPASTGHGRHDGGPPGRGGVLHRCFDGQDL
jgi:cytochrome c-type biogenesis protein CcmF